LEVRRKEDSEMTKKKKNKKKTREQLFAVGQGHRVALHIVSWANKLLAETKGNAATILELYVVIGFL
jgi:hypothetical protein